MEIKYTRLSFQCQNSDVSCPLFDGSRIGEQPTDLTRLTEKYTHAAIKVIEKAATKKNVEKDNNINSNKPFFLYLAYHQTHHPQFASNFEKFQRNGC